MKKSRQNSSRVALIVLLLLLFPITLVSAQTVTIDNLKYTLGGDTAVVSGYVTQPTGDLTIPATITDGGVSYRVTTIGDRAFSFCDGLTSITLPDGVTTIGDRAFFLCYGLTEFIVSDKSQYYSTLDGVLFNKDQSTLIYYPINKEGGAYTVPTSVDSIGDYAFNSCDGLTSITLPDGVTSIGDDAFNSCDGLTSITLPDGLTTIGDYAFYFCDGLTSITLPEGLTTIGDKAFSNCSGLTEFIVSDKSQYYSTLDGVLFNKDQSTLIYYPINKEGSAYTVPTSVDSIGDYAFYYCRGLTSITLPDGVTTIGDYAFSSCDGLTSITLPDGVTSIGDGAFDSCSGLTSITLPDGVTTIGDRAFSFCDGLTSITLPDGVTTIGDYAFSSCKALTSITLPDGVTTIGDYAFSSCKALTSITLPDGVTSIGDRAFYFCDGLTSITLPDGLTSIGDRAFFSCDGLTSITLPDGVTTIGNSAFSGCYGLTSITLPDGVTTIGDWAFSNCSGLTSITLPDGLTSIGKGAFSNCSGLTEFIVSDKNQYYSTLDGVLFNKDQSTLICYPNAKGSAYTVPTSVDSIGNSAFSGCRGLTSITLPDGLTTLGDYAFYYCKALTELHVPIATPIAISSSTFYGVPTATCTLYVPVGSKELYQAAMYWKYFQNIVEEDVDLSGIADAEQSAVRVAVVAGRIVVDGAPEGATIEVYSLSGQLVACTTNTEIELPQRGVYIVRVGGVSFKINS